MVSIPHNAQTSSLEESDKLEATKERGGVEEDEGGRRQRLEVAGIPPIRREMIQYENFSLAHKASSVLGWWKDHEVVLPILSKVVKKVLTVPASSAKSERVFSTGTNFITTWLSSPSKNDVVAQWREAFCLQPVRLLNHQRWSSENAHDGHSGEKPFACKQCNYSCTTASVL